MFVIGCGSATQVAEAPPSTLAEAPEESGHTPQNPPQAAAAAPAVAAPAVAAPTDEQIRRWTPAPFERLELLAIREWEKTSFTGQLVAAPDGRHFIVAGSRVLLWSIAQEEPEHVFLDLNPDDNDREIHSLAVSPDGRWLAVGDSNGMAHLWTLDDRQELVAKKLVSNGIECLVISPDGQEIATISYDNEVSIWNAATLDPQRKFTVNTNGLKRIEYIAPNRLVAAGESTSLWNTTTGEMVRELSPGRYSFSLARSPDGSRFIFGSNDALRIWNVAESKQEAEITKGVSGSELLAFSPDGKLLATANGRMVVLWNLAELRTTQIIDSFGWPIVGLSWLPKTNLLAIASDIGCTRLWGTASQGEAVGLKPLQAAVAMPKPGSDLPATPAQMEQVIDLRTFPRLPGSEPNVVGPGDFHCTVPTSADEAKSFYRYFLERDGWTPGPAPATNPAAMEFRKQGFTMSVQCFDSGDGKTSVMLHHAGNFDLRKTPKFDAAAVKSEYEAENTVIYKTKADLVNIEATLLRKLPAAGWVGYSRLHSSHSEQPDQRDLNFVCNGQTLRIAIGKFPADPTSYTIQYSLFPNDAWVPIPQDSQFVEFDGSTEPLLVATTKLTLDQARDFYDNEMAAQGWLVRKPGRVMKEDQCWLSYLRGQSDVMIGLTKLPDGHTLVRVGNTVGSLWELSQKKEEPKDKQPPAGLEAADFPALSPAQTVAYDATAKSMDVTVPKASLAVAAEQTTRALAALGWTAEQGGIRAEDYTFLTFRKGDREIEFRARPKEGNAVVNLQGDGLLWNKDLPTGKQIISFESWLRQNKLPPGLEMLDRYEAEMKGLTAGGRG